MESATQSEVSDQADLLVGKIFDILEGGELGVIVTALTRVTAIVATQSDIPFNVVSLYLKAVYKEAEEALEQIPPEGTTFQ